MELSEQSLWEATQACVSMETAPMFASFEEFERELARRILGLLGSTKTVSPAIITAMQFRSLASRHLQSEEVIEKLVDAGQIPLSIDWAQCCGHQVKVPLHAFSWWYSLTAIMIGHRLRHIISVLSALDILQARDNRVQVSQCSAGHFNFVSLRQLLCQGILLLASIRVVTLL